MLVSGRVQTNKTKQIQHQKTYSIYIYTVYTFSKTKQESTKKNMGVSFKVEILMIPKGRRKQSVPNSTETWALLYWGLHPFKYYVQIRRLSALNISLNKTKQPPSVTMPQNTKPKKKHIKLTPRCFFTSPSTLGHRLGWTIVQVLHMNLGLRIFCFKGGRFWERFEMQNHLVVCKNRGRGSKPPKMDGENNGKPYENGWFGGYPPYFLETPIWSSKRQI